MVAMGTPQSTVEEVAVMVMEAVPPLVMGVLRFTEQEAEAVG